MADQLTEDQAVERAWNEQYVKIIELVNLHAANHANIGWCTDDVERITTAKVYGYGYLTTNIDTLEHTWEEIE